MRLDAAGPTTFDVLTGKADTAVTALRVAADANGEGKK